MRQDIINIFLEYNRNIAGSAIPAKPETACRATTTGRLDGGEGRRWRGREAPVTPPDSGTPAGAAVTGHEGIHGHAETAPRATGA